MKVRPPLKCPYCGKQKWAVCPRPPIFFQCQECGYEEEVAREFIVEEDENDD
jgi:hypothetical protein